jgi:hypothetical protein
VLRGELGPVFFQPGVARASALRREELVHLTVEDVVTGPDGLTITLRRSKTDQEGEGRTIRVPFGSTPATCPVRVLAAWITAAGLTEGPIFRGVSRHGALLGRLSGREVARVVQRRAAAVGLEASAFGGHSLRAGLATAGQRLVRASAPSWRRPATAR